MNLLADMSAATITALTASIVAVVGALATAVVQVVQALRGGARDDALRAIAQQASDAKTRAEANSQALASHDQRIGRVSGMAAQALAQSPPAAPTPLIDIEPATLPPPVTAPSASDFHWSKPK